MIADLKPYAEYKESGLPWLGQVPGHWEVTHLGAVGRFSASGIDKKTVPGEPLVRMINYLDIYRNATHTLCGTQTFMVVSCPPEKLQPHNVKRGDLFFTPSSETSEDIGHSAVAIEDIENAVYSYHVIRLRPARHVDVRFSRFWCNNPSVLTQFSVASRGTTRKILDRGDFRRIQVVLPPPNEQALIGRFLDWANGRLERAIRAKRKVIGLLNEQKQAVIHRAVTRGLDPSVPLKPSGIPWLGDIPRHWEALPLKGVCSVQSGITLGKDYAGQALREYPYLRVANVQAGHVNLSVVKTIRVTKAEADRCMLQSGDVLMTEGGDLDKLGRGCVWNGQVSPCLHQNHVFAVRLNQSRLDPRFLSALMGTCYARAYFQSTAKQTTNLAATNKTKLGMFKVLLPGADEQRRILSRLDEELQPVNVATSRLEREIDLLREYRTRLVADVVTGKLDVRDAAARLPDEAPFATVEDDADLGDETETADEEAAV